MFTFIGCVSLPRLWEDGGDRLEVEEVGRTAEYTSGNVFDISSK